MVTKCPSGGTSTFHPTCDRYHMTRVALMPLGYVEPAMDSVGGRRRLFRALLMYIVASQQAAPR